MFLTTVTMLKSCRVFKYSNHSFRNIQHPDHPASVKPPQNSFPTPLDAKEISLSILNLVLANKSQRDSPLRDIHLSNLKRAARNALHGARVKERQASTYLPSIAKTAVTAHKTVINPTVMVEGIGRCRGVPLNLENRTAWRVLKIRHLSRRVIFQRASGVESHRRK